MNNKWTQIPKKEFKEQMYKVGQELKNMILSTANSEEGMNVLLSVLATAIGSIDAVNWKILMKAATSGVIDDDEAEIGEITRGVLIYLDKLRTFSFSTDSKYLRIQREEEIDDDPDETLFTFRMPRLPS